MVLKNKSIHAIAKNVIDWYDYNRRDLAWRKDTNPYTVWLSEIIFQQTKIEQGAVYYEKLVDKFPTVFDLANADEMEVLKVWEGLGYYSRARNLHFSAKVIVNKFNGNFPNTYDSILELKGVGPYTAAAIASISFKLPYPAIDGNVLRVSSRLFLIEEPIDINSTRKKILNKLNSVIDPLRPGDFNQGMMELGALICKPTKPLCNQCPVVDFCLAFKNNMQMLLPIKSKKVKVKDVYFDFLLFHSETSLLIEKRKSGIWQGLYQFPLKENVIRQSEEKIIAHILSISPDSSLEIEVSSIYKHTLSHRVIHAKFYLISINTLENITDFKMIKKTDITSYPFPRLINRFLESNTAKKNYM
jgi:A/G-specific adenine glycosylase